MLDRAQFLRPMAHRGLHDASAGVIENTTPAFAAAIAGGYGIECDLRPAADGTPFVFHDLALKRLIDAPGLITDHAPAALSRLNYRGQSAKLLSYGEFLTMVAGRVPLLVEIKSEWGAPVAGFLEAIGAASLGYEGPLALMSFDPAVMASMRGIAPAVPRGIVACDYTVNNWWPGAIDAERALSLTYLLESGPVEPSFYAYHVKALPTPVTRFVREAMDLPLFTWTVRTPADRQIAARWADAPIFEGYRA